MSNFCSIKRTVLDRSTRLQVANVVIDIGNITQLASIPNYCYNEAINNHKVVQLQLFCKVFNLRAKCTIKL